jgi:hypothetical protein
VGWGRLPDLIGRDPRCQGRQLPSKRLGYVPIRFVGALLLEDRLFGPVIPEFDYTVTCLPLRFLGSNFKPSHHSRNRFRPVQNQSEP